MGYITDTMTEKGLKRLKSLSKEEIEAAIHGLTVFVMARLRIGSPLDRTKSGAHCEKNLGMEPIDYYVGESVRRLFDPEGWEWQERFDLETQLKQVAQSIISKKVRDYKRDRENSPIIESIEDLDYELKEEDTSDLEEISVALHEFVMLQCKDDFNLEYYATCFFNDMSKDEIADDMRLDKSKIEVLHRKLVRRAMKFKATVEEET